MKLLDAKLENGYLVIDTDKGKRYRIIDRDAAALLELAIRLRGKDVITTTRDDWDPNRWFDTIKLAQ